jgi:manganese efflux pump family protein
MVEVLVLSVALAMDATAAAASVGAGSRSFSPVATAALLFGGFQSGMAAAGWWGGARLAAWTASWDHWLAFVLLTLLGMRTIREGLTADPDVEVPSRSLGALVGLALATSLDALAAGITLPVLRAPPLLAIVTIGAVTAGLSLAGGVAGRALGDRFGPKLDLLGGAVLIGLGVKVLLEHLASGS